MNRSPATPHLWTERYETLRRHFVENRQLLEADPLGLTLLLQRGIAGWMRTCQSGALSATQATTPSPQSWCPPIGPVWQQELTRLIAQMTAHHLYPATKL